MRAASLLAFAFALGCSTGTPSPAPAPGQPEGQESAANSPGTAETSPPAEGVGIAPTRARMALPGSGLWIDEPQRPIAMGAYYFGLLALVELTDWGIPKPRFAQPPTGLRG